MLIFHFIDLFLLELAVGYQFAFGKNWKVENDKEFISVPSKLNGNGFFLQTGIFLGFFSY